MICAGHLAVLEIAAQPAAHAVCCQTVPRHAHAPGVSDSFVFLRAAAL
jgi:hypothetical protein